MGKKPRRNPPACRGKASPRRPAAARAADPPAGPDARSYEHPTAEALLRPDVGTQPQFKKKKSPATYRYRLQRPVLPRLAGVLPPHGRMGRPEEGPEGHV